MSNYIPPTAFPQQEDSILEVQKRALFKRSYNEVTALARAFRTANTSTAVLTNPGYKGIIVTLRIYTITAGGVKIRCTTGCSIGQNTAHLDSSSLTTASTRTIEIYPGGSTSAALICNASVLGPSFVISVEHDTADSIEYELRYCLVE